MMSDLKLNPFYFNMSIIIGLAALCLLISETSETNNTVRLGDWRDPTTLPEDYGKLYEITAFNDHERSVLYTFQISNESVIFLNGVTNEAAMPMHVIVENCCLEEFEHKLQIEGIEYIIHDDLSTIHNDEIEPFETPSGFLLWDNVSTWIERYQKLYPILEKHVLSNTYEKRELFILSIAKRNDNPAVVIVGGEQGKDWMAPAVIFKVIKSLITMKQFYPMLKFYNFYFFPIFNPDGYVFSMAKDRFWDKNRKVFFPKKKCERENGFIDTAIGVNIDRNWYFEKSLGIGDGTECSSVYLGHKPLSEEEPKALEKFLNDHATNLMAFINVKGFGGRLITLPYSDASMHSNNHGVVMEIIMSACEQVYQQYNSTYYHGSSSRFFSNISGNSADWVKHHFNIPIVSTIHMKFKDENLPHSSHIEPLSEELVTILNEILMISKEIYGPLFNHQVEPTENIVMFALTTTVVHIVYCINNFIQ